MLKHWDSVTTKCLGNILSLWDELFKDEFVSRSKVYKYSILSYHDLCLGMIRQSIRDDPYWISWKSSLEPIELSSINKVSLVQVSFCSDTGSIRDDPCWTSRKSSFELIEQPSINKVSLVQVSFCSNTEPITDYPY